MKNILTIMLVAVAALSITSCNTSRVREKYSSAKKEVSLMAFHMNEVTKVARVIATNDKIMSVTTDSLHVIGHIRYEGDSIHITKVNLFRRFDKPLHKATP